MQSRRGRRGGHELDADGLTSGVAVLDLADGERNEHEGGGAAETASAAPRPQRGFFDVRGRLADMTDLGGASRLALFALFGLNLVDEFDRLAFSTLTPEIRDAFNLTDQQIVTVGSVSSIFVFLAAIPIGYLTDRFQRLRLAKIAAFIWGLMAVLMGVAWAVPILFVARFFSGVAQSSNDIVHTGLLADYYKPQLLPKVFQVHRLANPISQIASLLAGVIALTLGWRWAFILLAVPTFVLIATLNRLKEPDRGATTNAAAARAAVGAKRPSYPAATAQLLRIRSLRRVLVGFFVFGIGVIAFGQMLSLFFDDVYGFGPLGRGLVSFGYGIGMVAGIVAGGLIGTRYTMKGEFSPLIKVTAVSFLAFAAGTALMAVAPWAPLSMLAAIGSSAGLGLVIPVFPTLLVRIMPPNIRAQGQSFTLVAIAVGGLFSIPIAGIGENGGYRPALLIVALVMALSTPVIYSAHRFLDADIDRADQALFVGSEGGADEMLSEAVAPFPAMVGEGASAVALREVPEHPRAADAQPEWFPIERYDELTVAQISPLLPRLYADELPIVEARERGGKNRRSILTRLEFLAERAEGAPDEVTVGEWIAQRNRSD